MLVYPSLDQVQEASAQGRTLAIGVFDGVHRGHQRILSQAIDQAGSVGTRAAVVTFFPHPEAVLRPHSAPRMLTSPERKAELLEALGIEELVVVRFDRQFAGLSPEAFCRAVLSARLGARVVYVGENFRFGHGGAGTATHLSHYGETHGFEVRPVALVEEGGETVSSTRIRELLAGGHVGEAARLLGRPHRLEGTVLSGAGRGKTLEAPTANLAPVRGLALPRLGIYVTKSLVNGREAFSSVTSVGTNPTFESDGRVRIETVLLDYRGDLYGSHLAVDFLERIRGQRAFPDAASLSRQIREDLEFARRAHARSAAEEGS
ncbi:MAG: riboflavin biosynthesis protein RibF [Actinobacteria bacterium RBG_16_64_13]|nr:MAG: riboflavin biosynthesis protein RibF [Actinobacteria bacterium RBG_16_64_13]